MNDELIQALHSSEWAEAKLIEYEQKNIYLKCINAIAQEKGWSDAHRRMAQLLVLADAFESLKEQPHSDSPNPQRLTDDNRP